MRRCLSALQRPPKRCNWGERAVERRKYYQSIPWSLAASISLAAFWDITDIKKRNFKGGMPVLKYQADRSEQGSDDNMKRRHSIDRCLSHGGQQSSKSMNSCKETRGVVLQLLKERHHRLYSWYWCISRGSLYLHKQNSLVDIFVGRVIMRNKRKINKDKVK